MILVNLTPHAITIRVPARHGNPERDFEVAPTAPVARVVGAEEERASIALRLPGADGYIRVATTLARTAGRVEGLPARSRPSYQEADTMYVVSAVVLAHPDVATRDDVCAPATGPADEAVRDEAGRVVAVTRLRRTTAAAHVPLVASSAARRDAVLDARDARRADAAFDAGRE